MHEDQGKRIRKENLQTRKGSGFDKRGIDVPMPIRRVLKAKAEDSCMHARSTSSLNLTSFETEHAVSRVRLRPGSILGSRSPRLVQAIAPT